MEHPVVITTTLPGVVLLRQAIHKDQRGALIELYNAESYASVGITDHFVHDVYSHSHTKGTLRGLHYQLKHPQAKLIKVLAGNIMDVVVDIRQDSPHFGEHVCVELSGKTPCQLYIPKGFAHGFLTLTDTVRFLYKCSAPYVDIDAYALAYNDPKLGIAWPAALRPFLLSERDGWAPGLDYLMPAYLPTMESSR